MSKALKHSEVGTQQGCGTGFTGASNQNKIPLSRRMQRAPPVSANVAAGHKGVPVGLQKGHMCNPVLSGVLICF